MLIHIPANEKMFRCGRARHDGDAYVSAGVTGRALAVNPVLADGYCYLCLQTLDVGLTSSFPLIQPATGNAYPIV